jgi:hypothetical protein
MASNVVSDNFETGTGGVPQLGGTGATTCKAWANFNAIGTVSIRDSYNISSITDNGVGNFTIFFSNNMSNINYSVSGSAGEYSSNYGRMFTAGYNAEFGLNSFRILILQADNLVGKDSGYVNFQVFSN